jgi:hypothetical protein
MLVFSFSQAQCGAPTTEGLIIWVYRHDVAASDHYQLEGNYIPDQGSASLRADGGETAPYGELVIDAADTVSIAGHFSLHLADGGLDEDSFRVVRCPATNGFCG